MLYQLSYTPYIYIYYTYSIRKKQS